MGAAMFTCPECGGTDITVRHPEPGSSTTEVECAAPWCGFAQAVPYGGWAY